MNIEIVNKILDIRNTTSKIRPNVMYYTTSYFSNMISFIHPDTYKEWQFSLHFIKAIEDYFPYDGEFVAWLNHKVDNPEFEKEMQRYLNLKAFI